MHDLLTNVAPHSRTYQPPPTTKHDPTNTLIPPTPIPTFLEKDLASAHTLEVENFFRTVLGVSNDWVDAYHPTLRRIVESETYRQLACGREWRSAGALGAFLRRVSEMLMDEGLLSEIPLCAVIDMASKSCLRPSPVSEALVLVDGAQRHHTDLRLRLTDLAHARMSYGCWKSYVLGATVTQDSVQLTYYDHSIIVTSTPFNIAHQPVLFLTMLCGIGSLQAENGREDYGATDMHIDPHIAMDASTANPPEVRIRLSNGSLVRLHDVLHQQPGLVGRATCVARLERAGDADWSGKRVVAKISWPPRDGMSEVDVIEEARERAVETGQTWVLDHLPLVLHCEEGLGGLPCQQRLADWFGVRYEGRQFRMVVQEELYPLSCLKSPVELGTVVHDISRCRFFDVLQLSSGANCLVQRL